MVQRSTTERGWRLAGLLVLFVIACFWMPLGARDAGGVSSVIPALHPSTLAQPGQVTTHPTAQVQTVWRPAPPLRVRAAHLLAGAVGVLVVALLVIALAARDDDLRTGLLPGALRSRGPPSVL